jgi:hypothetical protein
MDGGKEVMESCIQSAKKSEIRKEQYEYDSNKK